jgi:hypothetical protein
MDSMGERSAWSRDLAVTIIKGDTRFEDFDDVTDWLKNYDGISLATETVPGRNGKALKVTYKDIVAASKFYWSLSKDITSLAGGDLTRFSSLKFWLKSDNAHPIHLVIGTDAENRKVTLTPEKEWKLVEIPISEFSGGKTKDKLIKNLAWLGFEHVAHAGNDSFYVDELTLVPKPVESSP